MPLTASHTHTHTYTRTHTHTHAHTHIHTHTHIQSCLGYFLSCHHNSSSSSFPLPGRHTPPHTRHLTRTVFVVVAWEDGVVAEGRTSTGARSHRQPGQHMHTYRGRERGRERRAHNGKRVMCGVGVIVTWVKSISLAKP